MTRLSHLPAVELKRFTHATLTKLALVAVVLVPLLYGALYLWSFWNPTGNLDRVPAALVVDDTPASVAGPDGKTITVDAGRQLAEKLPDSGSLAWTVTDGAEAAAGLKSSKYLAVVTVPRGFSASLLSPAGTTARQAQLQLTTDDSNNYLIRQISDTVLTSVKENLAHQVTGDYVNNIYVSLSDIRSSTDEAADGAAKIADGATSAHDATGTLGAGLDSLAEGGRRLHSGASDLRAGLGTLHTGADSLETGIGTAAAGAGDLHQGITSLDQGAGRLTTGLNSLDEKTSALPEQAKKLSDGAAQVAAGTKKVEEVAATVDSAADDANRARKTLSTQVLRDFDAAIADASTPEAKSALEASKKKTQAAIADFDPKIDQAVTRLGGAADHARELADGAAQVSQGAKALSDAAPQLAAGVSSAAAGAKDLDTGLDSANKGSADLVAGLGSAASGSHKLTAGLATARDGADSLVTGSSALADGATKAADGSKSLGDGLKTLEDGSGTLAGSLKDGAGKIPDYDDAAARAAVVADPVGQADRSENKAATYGVGFAPYFISLAMWVGALVTYMVLKPISRRLVSSAARAGRVMWANYAPAAALALGQTVVMWLVLRFGLGVTPVHPIGALAFTFLGSLAFTALMQWFNAKFGTPGRLLALAILMLQLTSAGGTYPIQTSPAFFQALHPFLPMTYMVSGLRVLISGGDLSRLWLDSLVLAGVAAGALLLTMLTVRQQRLWSMKRLYPALEV